MIGNRIADNQDPKRPGDYSKHVIKMFNKTVVSWKVMTPNKVAGFIFRDIIENSDRTISSTCSLLVQNDSPKCWMGNLERGEWLEKKHEHFPKLGMKI